MFCHFCEHLLKKKFAQGVEKIAGAFEKLSRSKQDAIGSALSDTSKMADLRAAEGFLEVALKNHQKRLTKDLWVPPILWLL